jgi:hypothetical protein
LIHVIPAAANDDFTGVSGGWYRAPVRLARQLSTRWRRSGAGKECASRRVFAGQPDMATWRLRFSIATGQAGGMAIGKPREGPADRCRLVMDVECIQRVRERRLQQQQVARDRRRIRLSALLAGAEREHEFQPNDVARVDLDRRSC